MNRNFLFSILALFWTQSLALSDHTPVSATCDISCTVAEVVEWSNNTSPPINLESTLVGDCEATASTSVVLYSNRGVQIVADSPQVAQLSKGGLKILINEHKIEVDAGGIGITGGRAAAWADYGCVLMNGPHVIHVPKEGVVEVTGPPKMPKSDVAAEDSCCYTTTPVLTVCWKS